MVLISWIIFLILSVVSGVHIGWALGMAWPAQSRAKLVSMVAGVAEGNPMPPAWLTFAVALAIFGLGSAAIWGAGVFSAGVMDAFKGWVLLAIAAVFFLRGALTYMPFGPLRSAVQPFRALDLRYFAPFCLLLAAGYLVIFLG